jgi:alcohol dehydrogenase (cytochrome c)
MVLLLGAVVTVAARDVTIDRLNKADSEPENWLVYGATYRSLRYSPLDQINVNNVRALQAAWAFQLGIVDNGLQSTPLVADGVMFIVGSGNRVFAVEAATGTQLWKYTYEPKVTIKPDTTAGSARAAVDTVRGVAIGHGHLYVGTDDNYVVAVDIQTGQEAWRTLVEDKARFGCSQKAAPLVVEDLVVVGSRGGDNAHRGHLSAYDGKTGQRRWWFNVIPGPGEKGNESWPGDSWMYGGGAPWLTGSYDPELKLLYWGTSNASSDFYGGHRSGDNLYTNSIVALRPATGELAWHFQTIPHDVWDYDAAYEQILVDLPVDGRPRKLLIHPSKNGFVYVLDRTNGEFISAFKYADTVTWASGLDSKGVPQNRLEPKLNERTFICPNWFGSRSWNQATFNPKTGLLYNIGIEWCGEFAARKQEMVPGKTWFGGSIKLVAPPSGKTTSHLDAFDPITGRRVWRVDTKHPLQAALLSTGGDLLFAGDPEGNFSALNARTGERLWSFQTGSGHRGGPISYAVNGKQYIATPSGWGSGIAASLAQFFPELEGARQGATVYAFALPDSANQRRSPEGQR